jgi:hypothetical protein
MVIEVVSGEMELRQKVITNLRQWRCASLDRLNAPMKQFSRLEQLTDWVFMRNRYGKRLLQFLTSYMNMLLKPGNASTLNASGGDIGFGMFDGFVKGRTEVGCGNHFMVNFIHPFEYSDLRNSSSSVRPILDIEAVSIKGSGYLFGASERSGKPHVSQSGLENNQRPKDEIVNYAKYINRFDATAKERDRQHSEGHADGKIDHDRVSNVHRAISPEKNRNGTYRFAFSLLLASRNIHTFC